MKNKIISVYMHLVIVFLGYNSICIFPVNYHSLFSPSYILFLLWNFSIYVASAFGPLVMWQDTLNETLTEWRKNGSSILGWIWEKSFSGKKSCKRNSEYMLLVNRSQAADPSSTNQSQVSVTELWLFNSGRNILWSILSTGIPAPLSCSSSELAYIP